MPWLPFPQGKGPSYPFDRRLGPKAGVDVVVKRKIPSPLPGLKPLTYLFTLLKNICAFSLFFFIYMTGEESKPPYLEHQVPCYT
jgi:hypothetical protein